MVGVACGAAAASSSALDTRVSVVLFAEGAAAPRRPAYQALEASGGKVVFDC